MLIAKRQLETMPVPEDASLSTVESTYAAELERIRDAYELRRKLIPAERYSQFSMAHLCMVQERQRNTLELLKRHELAALTERKILDIGCGTGDWIRDFINWGAHPENITGLDLLAERLETARRNTPPGVKFVCSSAHATGFPDASFDLVLQAMVFTSVLSSELKRAIAAEMLRVLRPGGAVLWYDFSVNNPANHDVRGVNRREIEQLFAGCRIHLRRSTLAPPLARVAGRRSALLYTVLSGLKVFSTYYLGIIQKPMPDQAGGNLLPSQAR
jgi:ubiquinone/menaquinone biosynthesis C-methylase UbiE